jgi:DTW domain-containing protein
MSREDVVEVRPIRSRRIPRCHTCGLHVALCVCADLPVLPVTVRCTFILHRSERQKSTNTGKLAAHMLEGARWLVRDGRELEPLAVEGAGAFVLFPAEGALSLEEARASGVRSLVVPDGTWQQAGRIARRDPRCAGLPCVRVDGARPSAYGLRRNARPDGLCTLEAVANALRVLEGPAVADAMHAAFARWRARAELVRRGNYDAGSAL